jgi:predicted NBD/HSP70 family sugar kinase
MAPAELAFGAATDPHDSTLYCYANATIGVALTIGGAVHNPRTGPSTIGHLPAGPTRLLDPRGTGRLDDAVSNSGTLEAARACGIPANSTGALAALAACGDELARALLHERSRVLGRAIGHIADVVNPDPIVIGGRTFTDFPPTAHDVARSVAENSAGPTGSWKSPPPGTTCSSRRQQPSRWTRSTPIRSVRCGAPPGRASGSAGAERASARSPSGSRDRCPATAASG